MCTRWPTSAMSKPFLCCERAFCCSMVMMWPVLMHVMSFDVVVISFDAMWLLVLCYVTWRNAMSCAVRSCDVPCNGYIVYLKWFCDNVRIQSTILYYKILLCITKYYSSTTLFYKVLLQYYSVLHNTTPVLLCTTQYYNVLLQYYSVLKYYSSTTLYYNATFMINPWHIWSVIYMIDVRRIWNVIYNVRNNRSHPPTIPNIAPATQNDCNDWSVLHMKRHL